MIANILFPNKSNVLSPDVLNRILERDFFPARSDDAWDRGLMATIRTLHKVLMDDPSVEELKTPPRNQWVIALVVGVVILVGLMGGFSGAGTNTRTRTRTATHSPSGGGGHSSSGTSG